MNDLIELTVTNGIPTTTSLVIAERFGKLHKNVLQSIEGLECSEEFNRLNFQPIARTDDRNRLQPMYAVTKDGFMFLAMGFTGKEAAAWKERFIAAFNEMERKLLENAAAQRVPKPGNTLFLSHAADIFVAADRSFRAGVRSGRSAGLTTAQSIRRANQIALDKTGINMLAELRVEPDLDQREREPAQATGWRGNSPIQFLQAFESGQISGFAAKGQPALLMPCLSSDFYLLYLAWCRSQGLKALHQPHFLNVISNQRAVKTERKRLGLSEKQSTVMHLPGGQPRPHNEHEADWLHARCSAFRSALRDYQAELASQP